MHVLRRVHEGHVTSGFVLSDVAPVFQLLEFVEDSLGVSDSDHFADFPEGERVENASVGFDEVQEFVLLFVERLGHFPIVSSGLPRLRLKNNNFPMKGNTNRKLL